MNKILAALVMSTSCLLASEAPVVKNVEPVKVQEANKDPKLADKVFAAKKLQDGNLEFRKANGLDSGNLSVTVAGDQNDILFIKDDAETAVKWLQDSQNPKVRELLLGYGFKLIVLVNKTHGTYIVDLNTGDIYKADTVALKK